MIVFAGCSALFTLANAAMLPLAANQATLQAGSRANLIIAACIVVPQAVVALASPWVGHLADRWGRRPVLLIGFLALPIRGLLLALIRNPYALVAIQSLDGLSGAALGVLLPLISADLTRGTNRFNLCMGVIGLAIGIGGTLSTTLAGEVAQRLGHTVAFLCLAAARAGSRCCWCCSGCRRRGRLPPSPGNSRPLISSERFTCRSGQQVSGSHQPGSGDRDGERRLRRDRGRRGRARGGAGAGARRARGDRARGGRGDRHRDLVAQQRGDPRRHLLPGRQPDGAVLRRRAPAPL